MSKKAKGPFSAAGKWPANKPVDRITQSHYLAQKYSVSRDLVRIHGGMKFFGRILPWLVFRRYFFFEGSPAVSPRTSAALDSMRVRRAGPADIRAILRVRPGYYSAVQVRERLEQGHLCFIVWVADEPVNIRWCFFGSVFLPYLGRTLALARDEVYFDEVYTVPRFRGRKIDVRSYLFMISWLKKHGFKKHFCLLTSWDTHLHRRYQALGLKKTGEVRSWNFLKLRRLVLRGGIKNIGGRMISALRGRD